MYVMCFYVTLCVFMYVTYYLNGVICRSKNPFKSVLFVNRAIMKKYLLRKNHDNFSLNILTFKFSLHFCNVFILLRFRHHRSISVASDYWFGRNQKSIF